MDALEVRAKLQEILNNAGNDFNDLAALVQQLHNNIQSHLNTLSHRSQDTEAGQATGL